MLGKSLLTGTWNRWLKTVLVIDTMFFMVIAITCPQRGPLTNLQYTMQYLSWMVCGGTTNLTLLKWTGFMRSVFKDRPLLYRGLVAVASLNIAVWTVAMIIMIAGRYVSNLNVGLVGGLLFAMIAPILFVVLAVYALALAILYTRRLQSMRISTVTKQLLMRVTHLMTVFFAGWFLISLCALFLGAGLTYNITWFCIGNAVYTVGVFVLFTGILIILDLADRIQDRGSLRSTSNPSRSQGAYLGASSTGGSRNGGTIGKAYADATNGDDDVDASKMGYVIDDGNDVLFPDEVNPSRQHRQPQAHQIEFGIPATPTVLPIHAEKNQYEYNGSPSSGHLYPPIHTHSARGQMRDQDLQLSSEHIRSNQSPPLRPRYAFPRNADGHGEVTLVPLGGAEYEDIHDVRFDPLGQRY
ncbi:hypothetical protein GQ42DRAFT_82568 [Ramicandelaber brevisporus]|nr:hypothetical protein GQ42DRAFT_82568 [Ramicandelaber brevisporus]